MCGIKCSNILIKKHSLVEKSKVILYIQNYVYKINHSYKIQVLTLHRVTYNFEVLELQSF